MSLFPKHNLIRRRKVGGDYVKGVWAPGEPDDVAFKSSWQPVTGDELDQLPEGKRNRDVFKAYPAISMDFRAADAHAQEEADVVISDGKEYEVTTAQRWDNGILPHWEIVCTRPKEGEA
jgi:hypothetical protein